MATRERLTKKSAKRREQATKRVEICDWVPVLPFYALRSCAEVLVQFVHLLHAAHRCHILNAEQLSNNDEIAATAADVQTNLRAATDLAAKSAVEHHERLQNCCNARESADKYNDILVADVSMYVANGLLPENLEDLPDEYMKFLADHRTSYIEILDNDHACVNLYTSKCDVIYSKDFAEIWAVCCKYTELLQNCLNAEADCRLPESMRTMDYAAAIQITTELRDMGARGLADFGNGAVPSENSVGVYTQLYSHTLGLLSTIEKMVE